MAYSNILEGQDKDVSTKNGDRTTAPTLVRIMQAYKSRYATITKCWEFKKICLEANNLIAVGRGSLLDNSGNILDDQTLEQNTVPATLTG